jgi:hypothetical protein
MSDKNVPIDFGHLGGKQVAPAIMAKPETPVDLSELYGTHGGLVVHPADTELSQPEQPEKSQGENV